MNKKHTDEEIIELLENCNRGFDDMDRHNCDTYTYTKIDLCGKIYITDCIDLIHRLQYNCSSASKASNEWKEKYEAECKVNIEQKAEIKRMSKELDDAICMNEMYIKKVKQNAELQKQMDELRLVIKNMEQGYYPVTQLRENMEKENQQLKDQIAEFEEKLKEQ